MNLCYVGIIVYIAHQGGNMNLMRLFTGIAAIVGLALLSGILIGIPTFVVLLLLKWFGVI